VYVHLQVLLRTKLASWRPNWLAEFDMAEAQLRARFSMAPAERPVPVLACIAERTDECSIHWCADLVSGVSFTDFKGRERLPACDAQSPPTIMMWMLTKLR
jgi:hypothetical protein